MRNKKTEKNEREEKKRMMPKHQGKERVKKKIKRWLRIRRIEWSHERKKKKKKEPTKRKRKTNMSFYVKESEVKRPFLAN